MVRKLMLGLCLAAATFAVPSTALAKGSQEAAGRNLARDKILSWSGTERNTNWLNKYMSLGGRDELQPERDGGLMWLACCSAILGVRYGLVRGCLGNKSGAG